jgi:hypothetical protein
MWAERAGSVRRVPATDVEALVIRSVREHLKPSQTVDDRSLINTQVASVEVQPGQVKAARDARLSVALTQHSNRVSTNASLRRRETQFSRAETKTPKRPCNSMGRVQRQNACRIADSSGLFALNREISVCMRLRGGAERTRTARQARSLSNESLIHPIHEAAALWREGEPFRWRFL